MARTLSGLIALLAGLTACQAAPTAEARPEAILDGTSPLVPDTAPPGSTSDHRRDAVVRTFSAGAACGGVLIGPRVVLTDGHCGHPDSVRFGADFARAPLRARVIACFAHPGALRGTTDPSCTEMGLNREGLLPGGNVTSLDYSILVLDRRVDATHDTSIAALPMPLSAELLPGDELRWVSIRHFPTPVPVPPAVDYVPDLLAGRMLAPPVFFAGLGQRFGVDPALGNFTLIDVVLGSVGGISGGDSGSAFYIGDPDATQPRLVALLSRFANAGRPVWDDEVGDWLAPFLAGTAPGMPGVYVGPADGPLGEGVDLDGLDPEHDVCPTIYDPDQLNTDGDEDGDDCDLCPLRRGVVCADTDGDGIGECCDSCPGVPNPDQLNTDGDRWGDACDNCDTLRNDLQTNCNEDAERELGIFDGPGDACDEVRCGETRIMATRTRGAAPLVSIETTDRINVDARQSDAVEDYETAFRFCRCAVANRDTADVRGLCRVSDGCSIGDVVAFNRTDERIDGWRRVTWTSGGDTSPRDGSTPATYAPFTFLGPPPVRAVERFIVDLSVRWALRDPGGDLERWMRPPPGLGDTFPTGRGAAGSVPGVFWTFAHAPVAGPDPDDERLPHHYWSGPIDAPRVVTHLPGPRYRCLDFLAPLLSRAGSAATLAGLSPLAFIARPGLPGPGPCVFDRFTPIVVASDVVIDPSVFDVPGLSNLNESVGLWVAASETGGWLAADGLRYVGVEPGAELPLVRRALVETPRGLEPLDKLNPCPNCPCPNCPPMAFPMAGMPDASALRGAAVADDPGVFVLSSTRRMLWRLGGTTNGRPRETIGYYFPDTDSWHSTFLSGGVSGGLSGGIGTVLAATYSPADDALYFLSERARETRGRGRPRSTTMALVRLDPDDDSMTTVAEWPRLTHNDVFAMSPDLGGALYIVASREGGRAHVGVLVDPREEGTRLLATFAGRGRLVPYGVRAEENGVTVAVVRPEGPTAVSHPRSGRRERGFFERCF